MSWIEGCYTLVKGDDAIDWACKVGMPKDLAEKIRGTHHSLRLESVEGKWVACFECKEIPEYNCIITCCEGEEKEIDHPLYGGKAKIFFIRQGENTFKATTTCSFGTFDTIEEYSEKGLCMKTKHKESGACITENWERKVKKLGWFKYSKDENLKKLMMASGLPPELLQDFSSFKTHFGVCGDICVMTEVFGDDTFVQKFKLDEETDFCYPGFAMMNRRIICTRTGTNSYKFICRGKNGEKEEWDLEFCHKGLQYTGTDKKTGETCKIWYEPCINICGKYKVVCNIGMEKFAQAAGIPHDVATKMANELDASMCIQEKGGLINLKIDSKINPINISFKWNEEFIHSPPVKPGETFKSINTMKGDTLCNVSKGSNFSIVSKIKFTDNFAIKESKICGTDFCVKSVMERC